MWKKERRGLELHFIVEMYKLSIKLYQLGTAYIILFLCTSVFSKESNEYTSSNNRGESLVEVRAVFINCEPDDNHDGVDSDIARFQRQELFKHNALHDCNKKLALTIKMSSEYNPEWADSDDRTEQMANDEYIPIDHVFEGSNRKRVRLLNPYVMRLRREGPKQAYKLHRIEAVSGVLTNLDPESFDSNGKFKKQQRTRRHMDGSESDEVEVMLGSAASVFALEHDNPSRHSYSVRIGRLGELIKPKSEEVGANVSKDCGLRLYQVTTSKSTAKPKEILERNDQSDLLTESTGVTRDKRDACVKSIKTPLLRSKRYQDIANEESQSDNFNKMPQVMNAEFFSRDYVTEGFDKSINNKDINKRERNREFYDSPEISIANETNDFDKEKRFIMNDDQRNLVVNKKSFDDQTNYKTTFNPEKDFTMYDIGPPSLWYNVNIQLYEKLSTSEGKTVWNDLTKGEQASVSSSATEWKGQDLNVRYQPAEWLPRDDFTLPMTSLCLLEPMRDSNFTSFEDDVAPDNANDEYIVVPKADITCMSKKVYHKRNENISAGVDSDSPNENQEVRRRVQVRVSRAIFGSSGESFRISTLGEERYLTMPHQRPHHAQIDLEVRADDNQLVRIGSSARISTVVTDSTRKSRTMLSLQATNTGLASARFKAVARDCGPQLMTLLSDKNSNEEIVTGPVILPPQHTRRMHLEVPIEMPADITHCTVSLMNDDEDAVAVRDVKIKKGDRCFCVWHCECVCLTQDPKLLCREMSAPHQVAAGLSTAERPRHTRSICYEDLPALDISSSVVGVFTFLLILGFIKAVLGLLFRRVGMAGLGNIIQLPRRLNQYYERKLCSRNVVYDCEGWPVHPDTRLRNVRLISCKTQFMLNIIFFVMLPIISIKILYGALCRKPKPCGKTDSKQAKQQNDIQTLERILRRLRPRGLCPWMTKQAEELSDDVVQGGVEPAARSVHYIMQPLLHETSMGSKSEVGMSGADSEQEDTDYVLMQMQKSRESLAKSQKKVNE